MSPTTIVHDKIRRKKVMLHPIIECDECMCEEEDDTCDLCAEFVSIWNRFNKGENYLRILNSLHSRVKKMRFRNSNKSISRPLLQEFVSEIEAMRCGNFDLHDDDDSVYISNLL